jgi:hypothetical protein
MLLALFRHRGCGRTCVGPQLSDRFADSASTGGVARDDESFPALNVEKKASIPARIGPGMTEELFDLERVKQG